MLLRRKTRSSRGYQEEMHHAVAINYTHSISHLTRDRCFSLSICTKPEFLQLSVAFTRSRRGVEGSDINRQMLKGHRQAIA